MAPGSELAAVRSFNRTVAERIGTYSDQFLGRARPYGEARTLWEIGPGGADVRELRARLKLDSGYMTRLLRALQRERLIAVTSSREDARLRHVSLTRRGRDEQAELERRSNARAASLLAPLGPRQRGDLVRAMAVVDRLLRASEVTFAVEDPRSADARWCIRQYFAELNRRFEAGFDPARSISADAEELTPPSGALMLARLRGRRIGCGALKFHGAAPAELKRMWIGPDVRGLGVGRRLLAELEAYARSARVRVVRLETNGSLTEAIALYRSAGYREVPAFNSEPYAHHWFEKELRRGKS